MSFDFTENVTLFLPEIGEKISQITEAEATDKKLVIEIAAIHEGLTANYNHYSAEALEKSLTSWVQPYPKPIIINHDQESDPLGRVMGARMDKEADGTPYVRLQVAILNPTAIERVMDQRFLTGSVGGKADHAMCSICNTDWVEKSGYGPACKHERGKVYNGKLAYFQLTDLGFKEYSFVNVPADQKSGLRSVVVANGQENDNDAWVKPVDFFAFDMDNEAIFSISESVGDDNILTSMKKKDAHYTYMNVKGTFLSVSAYDYKENSSTEKNEKITFDESNTTIDNESRQNDYKETEMSEKVEETAEDILSIVEQVSVDAAAAQTNADAEEATEETTEEQEAEEVTETTEEEAAEDTEEAEEAANEEDEQLAEEKDVEASEELADTDVSAAVSELESKIEALTEENARLKKSLHYMLAERVVDAKISVGVIEAAQRSVALEEHTVRTASSLADSLRDLAEYPVLHQSNDMSNLPKVTSNALVAGESSSSYVVEELNKAEQKTPKPRELEVKLESRLVDTLMGRNKL